ncbi:hypothetical protein ACFY1U_09810 [Streptomyces sp. NPDC001351]
MTMRDPAKVGLIAYTGITAGQEQPRPSTTRRLALLPDDGPTGAF